MAENQLDSGSQDLYSKIIGDYDRSRVQDLASRLSFGDKSALDEAGKGKTFIDSTKDVVNPAAAGNASGVGSALKLAGGGPSQDPNFVYKMGETADAQAKRLSENVSDEKKVRDLANSMQNQRLESSGDYLGAALNAAQYKARHPLETIGELAGMALPLAIGGANPVLGGAALAASTSGNVADEAYKKVMNADDKILAATNPDFAANPTRENKERIAKAESIRAGGVDAAIQAGTMAFGPLRGVAARLFEKGGSEAIANIAGKGLGNVFGGGLTDAAKIAASNVGIGTLKEAGVMAGQAAGSTINENYTNTMVDPNAKLFDGVATAVGGSIPAGIAMGALSKSGEKARASDAIKWADAHAEQAKDFVASKERAADLHDSVGEYVNSLPEFKSEGGKDKFDSQKLDLAKYITDKLASDESKASIESKRSSAIDGIVEQAGKAVDEGHAPDYKTAIDTLSAASDHGLHEEHFKEAHDRSKERQAERDAKAKEESDKAYKEQVAEVEAEKASMEKQRSEAAAKRKSDAETAKNTAELAESVEQAKRGEKVQVAKSLKDFASIKSFDEYAKKNGLEERHGKETVDAWRDAVARRTEAEKVDSVMAKKELARKERVDEAAEKAKNASDIKTKSAIDVLREKSSIAEKAREDALAKAKELLAAKASDSEIKAANDHARKMQVESEKSKQAVVRAQIAEAKERSAERARLASESKASSSLAALREKHNLAEKARDDAFKKAKELLAAKASDSEIKAANDHARKMQVESERSKQDVVRAQIAEAKERASNARAEEARARAEEAQAKAEAEAQKTDRQKLRNDLQSAKDRKQLAAEISKQWESEALASDKEVSKAQKAADEIRKKSPQRLEAVLDIVRKAYQSLKDAGKDPLSMRYDTKGLKEHERMSRDGDWEANKGRDWKTMMYHDILEHFPHDPGNPGSKLNIERHGMHLEVARELARLVKEDAARALEAKEAEVPRFRKVNGNVEADESMDSSAVIKFMSMAGKYSFEKLGGKVRISRNIHEAFERDPALSKRFAKEVGDSRVAGMFDPVTGEVHLFTDHIKDEQQLREVIAHEFTHRGVEIFMSKLDREEYDRFATKLLNGNAYIRKFVNKLIKEGVIAPNADAKTRLHEAIAHIAENPDFHHAEMAKNTLDKVIGAIREFVNKLIAKFDKDLADRLVPSMSDSEVLDCVRKMTNLGFGKVEAFKGLRATTIDGGFVGTQYFYFKKMSELGEEAARYAYGDDTHPFMAVIGKPFANMFYRLIDSGERFGLIRNVMSSQTKAFQDPTLRPLVHVLNSIPRMEEAIKNKVSMFTDICGRGVVYDGSGGGWGKNTLQPFKQVISSRTERIKKFIGENLVESDGAGGHKYQTSVDIERIFNESSKKNKLSAQDLNDIKRTYEALIADTRQLHRVDAAGMLMREISMLVESHEGAKLEKMRKLLPSSTDPHSATFESLVDKFNEIASIADKGKLLAARAKAVKSLAEFVEKSDKSGFIPLHREGDHAVIVKKISKDVNGKEVAETVFRKHSTAKAEAFAVKEKMEKEYGSKGGYSVEYEHAGDTSGRSKEIEKLSRRLDEISEDKGMTEDERQAKRAEVFQMMSDEISKDVSDNLEAHRRDSAVVGGYESDVGRGFERYLQAKSSNAARNSYHYQMTQAIKGTKGKAREEAVKMVEASQIRDNQVARGMKGMAYTILLGLSPASALLQHSQQYILAAPNLSARMKKGGGYIETNAAIAKASAAVARGIDKLPEGEREFLKWAIANGYVAHGENLRAASYIADGLGVKNKLLGAFANAAGSFMSTVENNNRVATFLAAYRLFGHDMKNPDAWRKNAKDAHEFATFADFANQIVIDSHFDTQKYNRSNIERSELGSLMLQFKMFPIRMLESVYKLPGRQKMHALGSLMLLSGVGGMPFMSNMEDLIDAASEWMGVPITSKKMRIEMMNAALGEDLGSIASGGALRAANMDIGQRIGLGDILPFTDLIRPSNKGAGDDFGKSIGASFSYISNAVSALGDIAKGENRSAFFKLAPSAAANAVKGYEMATTGEQRNNKGDVIRKNVGTGEAVMKGLGFNSADSAKLSEFQQFDNQTKEQHDFFSQKFIRAFAKASFNGDQTGMQEIQESIKGFNSDKLGTPMMINTGHLSKAVQAYRMTQNMDLVDRKIQTTNGPERLAWVSLKNAINSGAFKCAKY